MATTIYLEESFRDTQIEQAMHLLMKYIIEEDFWTQLHDAVKNIDLTHHTILEDDSDILQHILFMFNRKLHIKITPYKPRNWRFSSVIGHASVNTVFQNVYKLNSLTLPQRTGHLGHEIIHLFGYSHDHQGQGDSVPVVFGKVMEAYAEKRLRDVQPSND